MDRYIIIFLKCVLEQHSHAHIYIVSMIGLCQLFLLSVLAAKRSAFKAIKH